MTTYLNEAVAEQTFLRGIGSRLQRRKLLMTATTLILFALWCFGLAILPKSYRGDALVAIEGQTPTAAQGGDVIRDRAFDDQTTLGTELTILKSHELLSDTVERTGLLSKPEFNPNIKVSLTNQIMTNVRQSLEAWLPVPETDVIVSPTDKAMADTIDTLLKHVKFAPTPRSRVIEIAVTANNNKLAAQIANTMADLYISNHRDYRMAQSLHAREYLSTEITRLQKDAADKATALENYRIQHGLTNAMTSTLIQEQLSTLSTQLQTASAKLADLEGQAAAAKNSKPSELAPVLASPTVAKLREQEGILVAQQGQLIASYGANSPMLARVNGQLAQVRAAIDSEARRYVQSLPNDVAASRANVASLQRRMTDIQTQAKTSDEARARLSTLQTDADSARAVYNDFQTRLRAIDASMAYGATDVRVISHAAVPTRPSFPDPVIMLPAGLVLSFGFASLLSYVTARPKGIVGTKEIAQRYQLRDLGILPLRTPKTEELFESMIEQLLNRLLFLNPGADNPPKSLLITSALPQEGKTTTALALAEAYQRRGRSVFLVDADMRSTRLVKRKPTVPQLGLGDVLREEADLQSVSRQTSGGVRLLPAGTPRGNPTRLLALPSLERVIRHLSATHDLVIVDAPPALIGGDCEMLSRVTDATLFLAKWHDTQPEVVAEALKRLDIGRVVGAVLTMVDTDKLGMYSGSDALAFSPKLQRYYRHSS